MYQLLRIVLTGSLAWLLFPTQSQAQSLQFGKEHKGTINEKDRVFEATKNYAEVSIELKEGQALSITAKVLGDNRKVGIVLKNPRGKVIKNTDPHWVDESHQLEMKTVPMTGKYTIVVISTQPGGFTLYAKDPNAKRDPKKIEEEIEETKKRLEALKEELQKLKEQKKEK
jgi:hypothetical protein